jgi:hypothetical protein
MTLSYVAELLAGNGSRRLRHHHLLPVLFLLHVVVELLSRILPSLMLSLSTSNAETHVVT